LGSLRTRLALGFLLIALGAVALVHVTVTSGLSRRLVDQKLSDLAEAAARDSTPVERAVGTSAPRRRLDALVRQAADATNARVTLLGVASGTGGLQVYVTSDSFQQDEIRDLQYAVATEAARRGKPVTGTESGDAGRVGEAARPFFFRRPTDGRRVAGSVIVFSAPLKDSVGAVAVVRRRILLAGVVVLICALFAGSVVAARMSRRVKRLQRAARQVARGDFSARFPVDRRDELGELAAELDDMRGQLAELDSARKRFIATASHELRTPIFSLGGFLELLQDEDLDADTRDRFLTQLREQVARLQKLATALLDLSKLEAGSLELRLEPTDLGTLARGVADEFEPALAAHESKLELRVPPGPVDAVCDPERVAQVMRILIDNALTHTPKGTDMVVTAGHKPGGDGRVRMGVGDFGPGIHRSMLPHIFDPFFTTDDAQGSGLGLAIAHELADRMEGQLVVVSQPGRTTFTLELPA
jgi:signal transduction histidine kinase